jgi:uncharacterized protein YcbX
MPTLSQLYIYPIKSLGGIALNGANVTSRGLQYDRRYMLVDDNNSFITQRVQPGMALFQTAIEEGKIIVWHKSNIAEKLYFPLVPELSAAITMVNIWDDFCEAQYVSHEADKWFSKMLDFSCRLVYMPESTERKVDSSYAIDNDISSFADDYHILLIGESSLEDLNSRLDESLPMNRFRPNFVMKGGIPYEEDTMAQFSINGINFYGVKLCSRCVVTTTDQETGTRGKEPLKTLATYRGSNNKVLFGQNVLCGGVGTITIGDDISIIKTKPALI